MRLILLAVGIVLLLTTAVFPAEPMPDLSTYIEDDNGRAIALCGKVVVVRRAYDAPGKVEDATYEALAFFRYPAESPYLVSIFGEDGSAMLYVDLDGDGMVDRKGHPEDPGFFESACGFLN